MQPTDEQAAAIATFLDGQPLVLEAGAGTGKTTTLAQLSRSTGRRGVYTTMTKAMVEDAKGRMGPAVQVSTMHALAFRVYGRYYRHRLDAARMKPWDVAPILGTEAYSFGAHKISASRAASHVMAALNRFCQTADLVPDRSHFSYIEGIDPPEGGQRSYINNNALARDLTGALGRLWADVQNQNGRLPFTPAHYLKMWELNNPHIPTDYIMFDEAQDASPVMISIVTKQGHAQPVWVGDSQQAIFGFTGAVNALEQVPVAEDHRLWLTQSFRFGPRIAEVANDLLATLGSPLKLKGWGIPSRIETMMDPVAYLTRTNATGVTQLIRQHNLGVPARLMGGGGDVMAFAEGALAMQQRHPVRHPDLAVFADWDEVVWYAKNDPDGEDLRLNVTLVETFGAQGVIDALAKQANEADARMVISTAHKAKGQEWDTVALGDDFGKRWEDPTERRLAYVACTRPRLVLDVDGFPAVLQPQRFLDQKIRERHGREAEQDRIQAQIAEHNAQRMG